MDNLFRKWSSIIEASGFCFRLDEVENAADVNTNLSKTLKNREEKIENLKARLGFCAMVPYFESAQVSFPEVLKVQA